MEHLPTELQPASEQAAIHAKRIGTGRAMNLFLMIVIMKYDQGHALFVFSWLILTYLMGWINRFLDEQK